MQMVERLLSTETFKNRLTAGQLLLLGFVIRDDFQSGFTNFFNCFRLTETA